jgi:hypothetical protein
MRGFPSPQAHPARTAQSNRAKVPFKQCAFVHKMFLYQWCVVQRVQVKILIICQNKEYVWLLFFSLAGAIGIQWLLKLCGRKAD